MSLPPAASTTPPAHHGRTPPTWLFGLMALPFGVSSAFSSITIGRLLAQKGVPEGRIATIVAACVLPAAWQFIWAPVVDLGLRRKHWLILLSTVGGLGVLASLLLKLPEQLGLFTVLLVASQVAASLTSASNGGLAARVLPDELRGKAGGWLQAGNLGGGALGAGVTLHMMQSGVGQTTVALFTAAMIALPSLFGLLVDEPAPSRRSLGETFGAMGRDVWQTVRRREGWTAILIFLSPVGAAAGINLFSSIADSYKASPSVVTFVNGYLGGLVTAGGSIVGGWLCDRMGRRLAYFLAGGLSAACAVAMAFGPMTEGTYTYGALAYLFVAGFCYAAFTALVLEVIGPAGASASTQYTLCSAAGNQAIAYATWFDGRAFDWWHLHRGAQAAPRGLLFCDAALNIGGIVVLSIFFLALRRGAASPPSVQAATG